MWPWWPSPSHVCFHEALQTTPECTMNLYSHCSWEYLHSQRKHRCQWDMKRIHSTVFFLATITAYFVMLHCFVILASLNEEDFWLSFQRLAFDQHSANAMYIDRTAILPPNLPFFSIWEKTTDAAVTGFMHPLRAKFLNFAYNLICTKVIFNICYVAKGFQSWFQVFLISFSANSRV